MKPTRNKVNFREGCLPGHANFVSESQPSSFGAGEPAWEAGTLPTELHPQNRVYCRPKSSLCQRGALPHNKSYRKE